MAKKIKATQKEIEEKFEETAFMLNQERSDFLLPQVKDFVKTNRWINLRPEYQRRLVWDVKKRSLFIESLLFNIPIPPLFLYEIDLSRYEVMDGQQRLNAILDFLDNGYALTGLEKWEELNGLRFKDLPEKLKRGLDRRRISANVLVVQSSLRDVVRKNDVRKMVFERLNTGGQSLNAQELRNCLFSGPFNQMLIDAARSDVFCDIWEIPRYSENSDSDGNANAKLAEDRLYKRMTDCEIVLRFFAFKKRSRIKGSVKSILDDCMEEYLALTKRQTDAMRGKYENLLSLAREIFGDQTFRYQDSRAKWKLSQPLYDALMISLDSLEHVAPKLISKRTKIRKQIAEVLKDDDAFAVVVGRPNTATAIKDRIHIIMTAVAEGAGLA